MYSGTLTEALGWGLEAAIVSTYSAGKYEILETSGTWHFTTSTQTHQLQLQSEKSHCYPIPLSPYDLIPLSPCYSILLPPAILSLPSPPSDPSPSLPFMNMISLPSDLLLFPCNLTLSNPLLTIVTLSLPNTSHKYYHNLHLMNLRCQLGPLPNHSSPQQNGSILANLRP